ncbi:DUF2066 domain-containing protein [Pseudomonas sp. F1_0610]|uniref:DUF2066 domain-containing protein n=1 Tax=Pseudomonas sp. F1_0610 TaxID=3114284 RepID=UPI0039C3AEA9
MRILLILLTSFLAMWTMSAQAVQIDNFYQVRERLESQEPDIRDAGLQTSMQTLIQRLTGSDKAAKGALANYVQKPDSLYVRYGFEGNTLVVDYDQAAVDAAFQKAGVETWGDNRPLIVSWWVVDRLSGAGLLSDGRQGVGAVYQAAHYRGLAVRLPIGDLEEQAFSNARALNDKQALLQASAKYAAEGVLAVSAKERGLDWSGSWTFNYAGQEYKGTAKGEGIDGLAEEIFLQVNQILAPRFIVDAKSAEQLELHFHGVNLERYAQLEQWLAPFSSELVRVEGDQQVWRVRASKEQIRSQLGLAKLREQVAKSIDGSQVPSNQLVFAW